MRFPDIFATTINLTGTSLWWQFVLPDAPEERVEHTGSVIARRRVR
jgi:hypothetical protein